METGLGVKFQGGPIKLRSYVETHQCGINISKNVVNLTEALLLSYREPSYHRAVRSVLKLASNHETEPLIYPQNRVSRVDDLLLCVGCLAHADMSPTEDTSRIHHINQTNLYYAILWLVFT